MHFTFTIPSALIGTVCGSLFFSSSALSAYFAVKSGALVSLASPVEPDPAQYYQYFVITAAVLVTVKSALDLWKSHLRVPDPIPPLHKEYASRDNLLALEARYEVLAADLDRHASEFARAASASREKIYESIRALERGVAALQKETELLTQRLHHLDAKLDRLIERPLPRD